MIKLMGNGLFVNMTQRAPQRMDGVHEISIRVVNTDESKAIVFQVCNLAFSVGYMRRGAK